MEIDWDNYSFFGPPMEQAENAHQWKTHPLMRTRDSGVIRPSTRANAKARKAAKKRQRK